MPARRYVRAVLWIVVCGTALVVAIDFVVDPLQYFRRATWYPPHFSDNQRFQNPGLIRNYDFDTIVLGTSHSENFLPSDIARVLGRRALKLSISGSSIHEQWLTLRLALATGKVTRVLWLIDYNAFSARPGEVTPGFPEYLYGGPLRAGAPYLASFDTLALSWQALVSPATPPLEEMNTWWDRYPFGFDRALAEWDYVRERWNPRLRTYWVRHRTPSAEILALLEREVVTPIASHSNVRFDVIVAPRSLLDFASDFLIEDGRFFERLRFTQEVERRVGALSNARVWNFEGDPDVIGDFAQFKDMAHFSRAVNVRMLEHIARADFQPPSNEELVARVAAFLATTCARANDAAARVCVQRVACGRQQMARWLTSASSDRPALEHERCAGSSGGEIFRSSRDTPPAAPERRRTSGRTRRGPGVWTRCLRSPTPERHPGSSSARYCRSNPLIGQSNVPSGRTRPVCDRTGNLFIKRSSRRHYATKGSLQDSNMPRSGGRHAVSALTRLRIIR